MIIWHGPEPNGESQVLTRNAFSFSLTILKISLNHYHPMALQRHFWFTDMALNPMERANYYAETSFLVACVRNAPVRFETHRFWPYYLAVDFAYFGPLFKCTPLKNSPLVATRHKIGRSVPEKNSSKVTVSVKYSYLKQGYLWQNKNKLSWALSCCIAVRELRLHISQQNKSQGSSR